VGEAGIPLIGPNCIGFMNNHRDTMCNFSLMPGAARPAKGAVALVSQSGGFGSFILNRMVIEGAGIGLFVSTGNEADATISEVVRYALELPEISVVASFAESIRQPDIFLEAAQRAAELDKVLITLTPKVSEAVARAAMSHTASVVGSDDVYNAICDQYGVIRAHSVAELIDFARFLQDGRRMKGNRIAVMTPSGGGGVLAASNATEAGLDLPELSQKLQAKMMAYIPTFGTAANPIDTTAAMPPGEGWGRVLELAVESEEVDGVLPIVWSGEPSEQTAKVVSLFDTHRKPMAPIVVMHPESLAARGLPVFTDHTRAVRALAALAALGDRDAAVFGSASPDPDRTAQVRGLLKAAAGERLVLESTSKEVLALYRIPVTREVVAADFDQVVAAMRQIAGRVAIKVQSYDVPHQSDHGGLYLGVDSEDSARSAYESLQALEGPSVRVHSVLVQEMVKSRLEMALGMYRDPVFGAVVAVGLGGTLIELIGEPALLHPPFTTQYAERKIRGLLDGRILHKVRGLSDSNVEQLAEAAVGLGNLALELPEVDSVDVNPVMVTDGGIVAVDALITIVDTAEDSH
jgi:acyl-CoA synthetase (NDP forming)